MSPTRDMITLVILFISLYFEVFLLITYIDRRRSLHKNARTPATSHEQLPGVTIIVPCFNEEKTAAKTLDSLLSLDYPREKLHIIAVNDGSTDGTYEVLETYRHFDNIEIVHKENGGKHTALNLGIAMTKTELVGCLDADSYAKHDSLIRLVRRFDRPDIMAVVPSLHVHAPQTLIQRMQKIEYVIGIFLRSTLAELNALYVTPGPFTIFRKAVYAEIGPYRKAHNTEDMEMALRMQSHGMKIASAHDAVVYTSSPKTIRSLYKQRVRWTSGFLNNVRDYRYMLFNRRYSHVGGFVLPMALLTTILTVVVTSLFTYDIVSTIHVWYMRYVAIGARMFEFSWPSFSWFYMTSTPLALLGLFTLLSIFALIYIGSRLSHGSKPRLVEIVSYICLYSFISPWWNLKSLYNVIFRKRLAWR